MKKHNKKKGRLEKGLSQKREKNDLGNSANFHRKKTKEEAH